jgi:hypothetical protein
MPSGAKIEILSSVLNMASFILGLAYEKLGRFQEAMSGWHCASGEHHPHGTDLFNFVQMSLDKLSRYSELGYEG